MKNFFRLIVFWTPCFMSFATMLIVLIIQVSTSFGTNLGRLSVLNMFVIYLSSELRKGICHLTVLLRTKEKKTC